MFSWANFFRELLNQLGNGEKNVSKRLLLGAAVDGEAGSGVLSNCFPVLGSDLWLRAYFNQQNVDTKDVDLAQAPSSTLKYLRGFSFYICLLTPEMELSFQCVFFEE